MSSLASARSLGRSSSLQLPELVAPATQLAVARPSLARPTFATVRRPARSQIRVSAFYGQKQAAGVVAAVRDSCSKFLGRYDIVTTGVGSLLVTGYFVACQGQDVGDALNIAAFATVLGLVLQELLFHDGHENRV
eukprot:GHRR01001157.1.p1 GENE.GHRR01001157.1~~GHRR01001157.1.p1  ORF type:complete len:135 (+),score=31.57 GHRR01001157.1:157-561(+)